MTQIEYVIESRAQCRTAGFLNRDARHNISLNKSASRGWKEEKKRANRKLDPQTSFFFLFLPRYSFIFVCFLLIFFSLHFFNIATCVRARARALPTRRAIYCARKLAARRRGFVTPIVLRLPTRTPFRRISSLRLGGSDTRDVNRGPWGGGGRGFARDT